MKNLRRFMLGSFIVALLMSVSVLSAFADPPSRAVRIKYISGAVSMQPGGVNDWVEAVVNRPLTTSDRVWTDKDSRAELHLGSAALRMNAETSLTLTNVSDDIVQIELDQGTLNLHIRHLFGGETYEIDTPNQAFTILKAGDYRFDVDPNADTTSIAVWRGEGESNGQGPGVRIRSGHQATFTGGTSLEHQTASAPDFDGFDDWCRVRDHREDHARSYEYVSADVVGADDLDDYGTWRVVPTYGALWYPRVEAGWAPYHDGHWVWVEPWGWTWVDDAPWGFAPSHYGRWVNTGGYWAWAPGPVVVARPVYAPALVAWVGGPHLSVSVSFGSGGGVAWFPLGWGEPYVPSYHASRTYFQQVNVTNTHITNITKVTNNYYVSNNTTVVNNTNIRNVRYVNQNVAGAVTAVPTRAMTNSESVSRSAVRVNPAELRNSTVVDAAPVAPARTSVLGARAGAPNTVAPARAIIQRPVVSRVAPPARPVPFEAKQEVLARTPGRPLDAQTEAQIRTRVATQAASTPTHGAQPAQPAKPAMPANAASPVQAPGRPGMPANAAAPGKPGRPVLSNATEDNATRPALRPVTNPAAPTPPPARMVPRPPQAGMPNTPAGSAPGMSGEHASAPVATPAARPVPRPQQMERNSNPEPQAPGRPSAPQANDEMNRPSAPSNPAQPMRGSMPESGRPVPRPQQMERNSNPEAQAPGRSSAPQANDEMNRPNAPSNPAQPMRGSMPESARPVPRPPQMERNSNPEPQAPGRPSGQPSSGEMNRPSAPSSPAQPLRGPMPESARPVPHPAQVERPSTPDTPMRPSAPQSGEVGNRNAPTSPAQPQRGPMPNSERPVTSRPMDSQPRQTVEQPMRQSAPRNPQPEARPQPAPRPQPQPQAESRPQRQEQHQAPRNADSKRDDKAPHNNH